MVEVLHELREAADVQVGVVIGPREAVTVNVSLGVAGVLDIARAADVLPPRKRGRGAEWTHVNRRKTKRRHQTHATHVDKKALTGRQARRSSAGVVATSEPTNSRMSPQAEPQRPPECEHIGVATVT